MSEITEHVTMVLADRNTIERELGGGGMATAYLARCAHLFVVEDLFEELKLKVAHD